MTQSKPKRVDIVEWVYQGGYPYVVANPTRLYRPDMTLILDGPMLGLSRYDGFIPPASPDIVHTPRLVSGIRIGGGKLWTGLGIWVTPSGAEKRGRARHCTFFTRRDITGGIEEMQFLAEEIFPIPWRAIERMRDVCVATE